MRTLILAPALALVLAACGGNTAPEPKPAEKPAAEEPAEKPEEKPAAEEKAADSEPIEVGKDDGGEYPEVVVESDGDQMAYKQTEISIKADTPTRIKMKNNATSPAMVHNVVIIKKGTADEVGPAAMQVPADKDHVPADNPNILAATKLAKPGETTTVVVNLPAGEYEYICTFPGHYMLMKGVLKVEG